MYPVIPHGLVKRGLLVWLAALLVIFAFSAIPNQLVRANSYQVNTTSDTDDTVCDSTHCSLREAIIAANASPGVDTISFAIGTGLQTISPIIAMPLINDPVSIDGTTQPGFTTAPLIRLDGTSTGPIVFGIGFVAGSEGSSLRGLVINHYANNAIYVGADSIAITGNYLGINAAGTTAAGNGRGIYLAPDSDNVQIGGTTDSDRNIISGNLDGIYVNTSFNVVIQGNYIGTDVTGTVAIGNSRDGIILSGASFGTVGGTGAGESNLIRYNSEDGVVILDAPADANQVRGNQIDNNGEQGIDLNNDGVTTNDVDDADTGPNGLQNFPVITNAVKNVSSTTLTGTLNSSADATFSLDFYAQAACDASGYGEGETYLGSTSVTTDLAGFGTFSFNMDELDVGTVITATATSIDNQTSEFSACTNVTLGQTATVEFSNSSDTVTEATTTYDFSVTLTTSDGLPLVEAIIVDITDERTGTADSPWDYDSFSRQVVTFPVGSVNGSSQSVSVGIQHDTLDESDETIEFELSASEDESLGYPTEYTLTIQDNDTQTATVEFSSSGFTTTDESATSYNIGVTVTTSDGYSLVNDIDILINDLGTGSATDTIDYVFDRDSQSFDEGTPNGTTRNLIVTVVQDTLDEANETVNIELYSPNGLNASLGTQRLYTLTITDDDTQTATVQFSSSGASTPDEAGTTYDVEVTLTTSDGNPLVNAITVDMSDLNSGDATAGTDYSFSTTTLNFAVGAADGSAQNATLGVIADTLYESDETVELGLDNLTGTNASLGSQTSHTFTIADDDDPQSIRLTFNTTGFTTADESNATYNFYVVLTTLDGQPLVSDVTMNLDVGGSATSSVDYFLNPTSLTFTAGAGTGTSLPVDILLVNDILDEANETLILGLIDITPGSGVMIDVPSEPVVYTLTITDDDTQTATVQFSSSGGSTPDEVGTTYDVDVTLTTSDGAPLIQPITVDVSDLLTGTATATADYNFSTTTLTFAAGATDGNLQSAVVAVVDDTDDESDETVMFGLGNLTGTNASLDAQTDYTFTITDDDAAPQTATVEFSSAGFTTPDESGTSYNIDVVLTTSDGQPLINQIVVDVSDLGTGTATLASDYNYSAATLVFDAGTASGSTRTPNFAVTSDSLDEPDETADFGLVNLTGKNASLGSQTSFTVTITDDDAGGTPSVTVTPTRRRIHVGETRTYSVVLDSQPGADVTITVSQPERCVVRPRTLTFTPENWDTPQTVSVRARNFPGTRCRIRHAATGGGYDGVVIDSVVIRIVAPAWEG